MKRLIALLFAAVPLFAQVRETLEVSITNLDVVVTDGKGNRVRGLTKADFEVIENGQVREITNFTEYASGAAAASAAGVATVSAAEAAAAAPAPPPPPRRIMLLFDAKSLTPFVRRGAAEAANAFVEQHVRPNDKVLVAVLSQQFTPRTEWTSDRAELRRAIEAIGKESSTVTLQEERKRAEDRIETLIEVASSLSNPTTQGAPPPTFGELMQVGRNYAEYALQDTRATAALLGTVVGQLGRYPEKKALILIGEGLDARPGWEIFQKLESIASRQTSTPGIEIILRTRRPGENPLSEGMKYNTTAVFAKLADTSYRAGVPVYALNPGTNQDVSEVIERYGSPRDYKQEFATFASRFQGYDLVATYSGGAAFVGRRADLALSQVAADLGGYYSIGFRSSALPKDAGSIRVRTRGDYRVRTALATAIPTEPTDAITDAVLAHHVVEPETNDLDITVEAGDLVPSAERQQVKISVVIPIRNLQLARQGSEVTGGFDVYLSISDGKSYFSPVTRQSHAIKWPADQVSEDDERTITYSIDVTMEPGASMISVGVIDHGSKKTGYAVAKAG